MWLTVIFPNLCVSVYILTYTPHMAPAHPFLNTRMAKHNALQGCGENINSATIHHSIQSMSINNSLLVYDNCYSISCHSLEWINRGSFHTKGVLQSRCLFTLPLHRRWSHHVHHITYQHRRWDSLVQPWTYTIYKVYDNYATQMVTWSKLEPRMSLAH